MVQAIFEGLAGEYRTGMFSKKTTFYLSIDDVKKTITLDGPECSVEDGKTVENADCVCKTTGDMFVKIWNDGYRPGMGDFFSGAIKSNAPHLLQQLLAAFGK